MDVVLLEQGALIQRLQNGDFEAINFIQNWTNLDPAMSPDFWLSSGSAHIWNIGQSKPATDWEKAIDDLMITVMSSVDQVERKKAFDDIQKIFAEHLPVLYFVAPRLYMGVSSRVGDSAPLRHTALEHRAHDREAWPVEADGTHPQASRVRARARLRRVVRRPHPDADRAGQLHRATMRHLEQRGMRRVA